MNTVQRRTLLVLAMTAAGMLAGEAAAQSPQCQRFRTELASLEREARAPRPGAGRAQGELAQAQGRYAAIGCNRQQFLFFGSAPPAECSGLKARIGALQAQVASGGGGFGARRQQILAAIDQHCNPRAVAVTAPPQQPRGFFESLFGVPAQPQPQVQQVPPPGLDPEPRVKAPIDPDDPTPRRGFTGGRPVCVRTCDGFFFPLANSPGGRDGVDEMCQALCPGTETLAFFLNGESIENASRRDGSSYLDLPNASKFKRTYDSSCSCKKPGQTWAQVLGHAEEILGSHGSDIIVTAEKAEELSRPRLGPPPDPKEARQQRGKKKNEPPKVEAAAPPPGQPAPTPASLVNPAVVSEEAAQPQQPLVTDGAESAGINDKVKAAPFVGRTQGETKEAVTPTGARKQVRIIGGELLRDR